MRVFAYIARYYGSAAEATSLISSVASLAIIQNTNLHVQHTFFVHFVAVVLQRQQCRFARLKRETS